MQELLDVYDENKVKTNKVVDRQKGAIFQDGEFFLYSRCWIINSDKKILLTQRNLNKIHGGTWEPTGGCVRSGETSKQGIIRELKEEIGVSLQEKDLTLIKTIKEIRKTRSCFRDIYLAKKDIKISDINFLDGEVINAKYVTINEFKNMREKGEISQWLSLFEEEYYKIIKG